MSNGRSSNDLILGRGGGITSNITLLEPKKYKRIQRDAVRHLDEDTHDLSADDTKLIKEALGLDGISPS